MEKGMTLLELQSVLGDRIKITLKDDLSPEERQTENEQSIIITNLAKQMINNGDLILGTEKLAAQTKSLQKSNATAFHYHTNRMGLKKHIEHQYTAEEDEFLRANSPLMTREELTKEFNNRFGTSIKQNTINMRCCLKGWSASNDGQFRKGSTPWSKTKGGRDEYVKTLKGGNSKSFKKGLIPHNTKAIGYERKNPEMGK